MLLKKLWYERDSTHSICRRIKSRVFHLNAITKLHRFPIWRDIWECTEITQAVTKFFHCVSKTVWREANMYHKAIFSQWSVYCRACLLQSYEEGCTNYLCLKILTKHLVSVPCRHWENKDGQGTGPALQELIDGHYYPIQHVHQQKP